ncbi:hypothetical protein E2C01_067133 [Portunus trituberculatus]|uniref:Uncharacterized protein n=1 Tax=Portunus trituberculatus TaxID=210409 RepID=A0A5B7HSS4_PORTR|nr:hypothetical protein [Portunus trituberculatus]
MLGTRGVVLRAGGRQFTRVLSGLNPSEGSPDQCSGPMLGLIAAEHVRIKDPAKVEELVNTIISGGFSRLQVRNTVLCDHCLSR